MVAGIALCVAASLGGVFVYSMAAVASMSDKDMQAIRSAHASTKALDVVSSYRD